MKKTCLIFTCTLMLTTIYAKTKVFDDTLRIVPLDKIPIEQIQAMIHLKNSDFIIEFKEGTIIPFQFLIKNRTFSAKMDPNLVFKVDKTCYLRITNKKCYMSEDLINWEKAEKFMTGQVLSQISQNINQDSFTLDTTISPYQNHKTEDNNE